MGRGLWHGAARSGVTRRRGWDRGAGRHRGPWAAWQRAARARCRVPTVCGPPPRR